MTTPNMMSSQEACLDRASLQRFLVVIAMALATYHNFKYRGPSVSFVTHEDALMGKKKTENYPKV